MRSLNPRPLCSFLVVLIAACSGKPASDGADATPGAPATPSEEAAAAAAVAGAIAGLKAPGDEGVAHIFSIEGFENLPKTESGGRPRPSQLAGLSPGLVGVLTKDGTTVPIEVYAMRVDGSKPSVMLYEPESGCQTLLFHLRMSRSPTYFTAPVQGAAYSPACEESLRMINRSRTWESKDGPGSGWVGEVDFQSTPTAGTYQLLLRESTRSLGSTASPDRIPSVISIAMVAKTAQGSGFFPETSAGVSPSESNWLNAARIDSPDGYYWVTNTGVSRLSVEDPARNDQRFVAYFEQGTDYAAGFIRTGSESLRGKWFRDSQTLHLQFPRLFKSATHCNGWGEVQSTEPVSPSKETSGVWMIYRKEGPRQCVAPTINVFTCGVRSCAQWSDDGAFSGGSDLLVKDREVAYRLYAGLEKWTRESHGSRSASSSGSSSGGPCGDRTCYEELVNSWAVEDIWK